MSLFGGFKLIDISPKEAVLFEKWYCRWDSREHTDVGLTLPTPAGENPFHDHCVSTRRPEQKFEEVKRINL